MLRPCEDRLHLLLSVKRYQDHQVRRLWVVSASDAKTTDQSNWRLASDFVKEQTSFTRHHKTGKVFVSSVPLTLGVVAFMPCRLEDHFKMNRPHAVS